jgi:hypothetical protein
MDAVDRIYDCERGPIERTSEHFQLETQQGFFYGSFFQHMFVFGPTLITLSQRCQNSVNVPRLRSIST